MKYLRHFPRLHFLRLRFPRSPLTLVKNLALFSFRQKSITVSEGARQTPLATTGQTEDNAAIQPPVATRIRVEGNTTTKPPLTTKKPKRPLLTHIPHVLHRSSSRSKTPASPEVPQLADLIDHNIETIISLHMHAELKVNRHQRILERMTAGLGRPSFFYLTLFVMLIWILFNLLDAYFRLPVLDPAPFYWLQGIVGFCALLMTILVLTTQNRQAKLSERNKHLDLQVNLVVEHKVSKLIALVEELRRDMPTVKNRYDEEAEAMSESVDPQAVFLALDETLAEINPDEEQLVIQSDLVMNVETSVTTRATRSEDTEDTELSSSSQ